MKQNPNRNPRTLLGAFLGAAFLVGCSQPSNLPTKEVEITANDQMKFSVATIEAQPGQQVKLTLKNTGTMPKESMGHNWVLFKKGTGVAKIVEEGFAHTATDYIPPDMLGNVLAKTKILGPGESETITFTAPSDPESYDFICSFPGHYVIGMKGALIVK